MTAEQRHRCMSHIRSRDTRPETMVRHYLFSRGFRYRKNVRALPGTPDIVLGRYRTVIFVNGCFWHGHEGCRYFRLPKTNAGFWQQKIERNQARDARDRMELRRMGWHVIQVWECQLKPRERAATLRSIEQLSVASISTTTQWSEPTFPLPPRMKRRIIILSTINELFYFALPL